MSAIQPLLLLTVAAAFQWRNGPVAAALSVAAIFIAFAIFQYLAIQLGWVRGILLSSAGVDKAYHDTYYVISSHTQWLWQGILSAVIAACLAAETRFGRLNRNLLLDVAFWIWLIALLAQQAHGNRVLTGGMPRRYVDYWAAFDRHVQVQSALSLTQQFALFVLAGLIILSIVFQRQQGNR